MLTTTAFEQQTFERFGFLKITLRIVAAFAIVTGIIDILLGTWFVISAGSQISSSASIDPTLDSHIRFLSAIWLGYGAVLWWATNDLRARGTLLYLLAAAMFIGGAGRLLSIATVGLPPALFIAFALLETLGSVLIVLWYRRVTSAD